MTYALFIMFGVIAVACGLAMVLARSPVYGAIYLIGALGAIAGEFLLLEAPLLAALQVLVYAGAIMVLYLFVIMLLNLGRDPGFRWWRNWRTYAGLALTGLLGYVAYTRSALTISTALRPRGGFGVLEVARRMYSDPTLILLIEALGVLLTISVVGAIYLGRRFSPEEKAEADRMASQLGGVIEAPPARQPEADVAESGRAAQSPGLQEGPS